MTNLLLAIRNILLTNTVQAMLNGGELFVHASKDAGDVVIMAHDQACEFLNVGEL
jgi:hypothetical protein